MRRLAAVLVALLAAGCLSSEEPEHAGAHAAEPPPADPNALWFVDTDGATQVVWPVSSNATVLFFMATWCPTCKEEAPMMASVHEDYAAQGVRFFSLDFDASETNVQIEAWKQKHAQPWPHGVDHGMRIQRAVSATGASSIVALDDVGEIVARWKHGGASEATLRKVLDAALAS